MQVLQRIATMFLALIPLFVIVWGIVLGTNPYVPPGHEGYVYEEPRIFGAGGYKDTLVGPTSYGRSLLRNKAILIDMRPETYTEEFKILAADDLNIAFRFHTILSIAPGGSTRIIQDYGGIAWYERFVREPLRTFIRDASQRFNGTSVKNMRDQVATEVTERLQRHLEGTPIQIISAVVGDIDYPEAVTNAVDKKLAAQQLLEEKATQMEIAKRDADIEVLAAQGSAEAQRIISSTLNGQYLQYQAITAQMKMATSPNHTTIYIPVGNTGIPLVQNIDSGKGGR